MIGEWRTGYPEAMRQTFARHLDDAERALIEGMNGIAVGKFLDPKGLVVSPDAPDLVPAGFVRHVLARAGGTTDIASTGYAYVWLTSDGRPLPGLATGPLLTGALTDHGAAVEAFRWVYGPALRSSPFRPHVRLDGVLFSNFDDPRLANTGPWPPFAFFIPGDHAGCRCDYEPVVLSPEAAKAAGVTKIVPDVPLAQKQAEGRARRQAAIDDAAARAGVSPDEVRANLPRVRELRRAIADDAARVQADTYALLNTGEEMVFLKRPPVRKADRGGEWDWLEKLSQDERSRLSRAWYVDGPSAPTIDNVIDRLRDSGIPGSKSAGDVMADVWLPLNRRLEAAGALRKGRLPVAKHYGGSVNLDELAPTVSADGYDIARIIGAHDEDAAAYLATLDRGEFTEQAYRALGPAANPLHGPAPHTMSFQAWEAEVRDLEYGLREFPDSLPATARARYDELVPLDLDEPGLDYESLYSVIVHTARTAELDLPDTVGIPWADDLADPDYLSSLDDLARGQ